MPTVMRATVEKGGFTNVKDLMASLVQTLVDNGMTRVFPASYDGSGAVILEPSVTVDELYVTPVAGQNPTSWRLAFTVAGEKVQVNAATPVQLLNDGTISTSTWNEDTYNPGHIKDFINRSHLVGTSGAVYPMSYIVSVSDHGIFLAVWDQSTDEYQNELNNASPSFRWLLIQRPVLHTDGAVYKTGRAPVFCVYTVFEDGLIPRLSIEPLPSGVQTVVNGIYYKPVTAQFHHKFIVREADVYRPSLTRPADQNVEDSAAIINSTYQVSVSEDNRYVVTIPKGLNTTRYAYTHELDMLAYTSADVIGQWSEIELDVYGGNKYLYRSLLANRIKNTGMRILCRVKPAV